MAGEFRVESEGAGAIRCRLQNVCRRSAGYARSGIQRRNNAMDITWLSFNSPETNPSHTSVRKLRCTAIQSPGKPISTFCLPQPDFSADKLHNAAKPCDRRWDTDRSRNRSWCSFRQFGFFLGDARSGPSRADVIHLVFSRRGQSPERNESKGMIDVGARGAASRFGGCAGGEGPFYPDGSAVRRARREGQPISPESA